MQLSELFCVLVVVSSACAEPVVTPKHQQVLRPGHAVVRCEFSQPLLDCKIRLSELNHNAFDQLLDFGNGSRTASVDLKRWDDRFLATASYEGDGLSKGHCGVSMALQKWSFVWLVECMGQTEDHGWSRGFGHMIANNDPIMAVASSTPPLVVAAPGSDVDVLFRTEGAIDGCGIDTPAASFAGVEKERPLPSDSRYRFHGAGLEKGECGFRLTNVTQQDAGVWSWMGLKEMESDYASLAWLATVVVVSATPEKGPELTVQDPASLRVDSQLTATCRAPPGAPPAKLTWLLDGQVVRQDDGNDVMPALHVWQPMEAVQTFKRRLSEDDVGKRLECRADHTAGSWSASDSWLIATSAT